MAINLIACTYYAPMLLMVSELVETEPLQEIQEEDMTKKIDFVIPAFRFLPQGFKIPVQVYFCENSAIFSVYEQEIPLPPPDFSRFS
jgi:signal transduction histidine kinase